MLPFARITEPLNALCILAVPLESSRVSTNCQRVSPRAPTPVAHADAPFRVPATTNPPSGVLIIVFPVAARPGERSSSRSVVTDVFVWAHAFKEIIARAIPQDTRANGRAAWVCIRIFLHLAYDMKVSCGE